MNPISQPKVIVRERIGSIPYGNMANWEEGIEKYCYPVWYYPLDRRVTWVSVVHRSFDDLFIQGNTNFSSPPPPPLLQFSNKKVQIGFSNNQILPLTTLVCK